MNPDSQNRSKPAEPIKDSTDIERIRELLGDRPRDRLLFEAAIHSGIPMKWLLNLRVSELAGLAPGDSLVVLDNRGRKVGVLAMRGNLRQCWQDYWDKLTPQNHEYIFRPSNRAEPLKIPTVTNMVNEWFEKLGMEGPRGVKSLKRTYEYHFAGGASTNRGALKGQSPLEGLKQIHMVSASDVAYQNLLEAIISGSIPPGERLLPEKIAVQMNVSRMPVREALQRLRAAGFVTMQARGGMIVNKLSREDLEEIQHIRLILECDAAAKAAKACDMATVQQLEATHAAYSATIISGQRERSIKHNKIFHMTIYKQADMPIMAKMIESLLDRISPYLHIELQKVDLDGDHLDKTLHNHRQMLNAIKECDADKLIYWLTLDHSITTSRILQCIDR